MHPARRAALLALIGLASWVGVQGKLTAHGPPVDQWFVGGPHRPPQEALS